MTYYERPKNEEELQKREAIGTIRASRFVRKFAKSKKPIDIDAIYNIHKIIFKDAWPEIAGVLRTEQAEITDSPHLPPHHRTVPGLMIELNKELKDKVGELRPLPIQSSFGVGLDKKEAEMVTDIIHVAAWIHHKVVHIHPFIEGNGRTARLVANLILERFCLIGISIKIEKESKNNYLAALRQIDKMGDYAPLEEIITDGLIDRYSGIPHKIV